MVGIATLDLWYQMFGQSQELASTKKPSILILCSLKSKSSGSFLHYGNNGHAANIYLFKVKNRVPRKRCEICSKLTIKTPERRQ